MGRLVEVKTEFHPREGYAALRQAYVDLLRIVAADVAQHMQNSLPMMILLRMEKNPVQDQVTLTAACFEHVEELQFIHRFLGVEDIA